MDNGRSPANAPQDGNVHREENRRGQGAYACHTRREHQSTQSTVAFPSKREMWSGELQASSAQPHNFNAHGTRAVATSESRAYDVHGRANWGDVGYLGKYGGQARKPLRLKDSRVWRNCLGQIAI